MRIVSLVRVASVALLGFHVLVNGLSGCGGDDDDNGAAGAAGSSAVNVDDIVYVGEVTDEAAESMLGVAITTDDTRTPLVSSPTEGQALPAATAPTFTWAASTASLVPAPRLAPTPGTRLPAWLGPERSAHAHGAPFTGIAYVLTFSTASNAQLVRVATEQLTYTPDDAAWATLKGAGGPITVKLIVARLENNLLVAGGGPYTSSKGVSFTVTAASK